MSNPNSSAGHAVPDGFEDPDTVIGIHDQWPDSSSLLRPEPHRAEPIRGHARMSPVGDTHGQYLAGGDDVIVHPEVHQLVGSAVETLSRNLSGPQHEHAGRVARGEVGVQDYPSSGRPATRRIRAALTYAQPTGHDPINVEGPLDKYVAADTLLPPSSGPPSGFARFTHGQPVMETELGELVDRGATPRGRGSQR